MKDLVNDLFPFYLMCCENIAWDKGQKLFWMGSCGHPCTYSESPAITQHADDRKVQALGNGSADHCTNNLWSHNQNFGKICVVVSCKIMIQSGHDFAHVTTAELSWHVQNCDLIGLLLLQLEQKEFWWDFRHGLKMVCGMVPMIWFKEKTSKRWKCSGI